MVEGCVFGCGFQSVKQSDAPLPRKRLPDSMVWHVEPPLNSDDKISDGSVGTVTLRFWNIFLRDDLT